MKILVVDDEAPARDRLKRLIEEHDDWQVVAEAANGHEALERADATQPDLVLLDIRMPGMDGIETARHLAQMDEPPAVIFTTAFNEYAVEAFAANAVGYVLKPIRRERLADALQRASRLTRPQLASLASRDQHQARKHISARVRGELRLVPVRDVLYFHADQKYVTVRHHDGELLIDEPIKELADEFSDAFVRVHRSMLVSVAHIEALAKNAEGHYEIRLKGLDECFPVSRRLAPAVVKKLKKA
ncbi:MAG: LytTR family DNA-binding domain-containing protein [Gammaproteobacteria bacterium]|nr:LytTR family DNA-binding domain-containing protein [Gammaproteobacteria bacterium]MCZ6881352.1 LytTR family DNA-binding domain-containing protein [Gammaproteobacteria bacterium]